MKVIYVAGYSHSGSTLLDVILSSSDEVVGLGEVSRAEEEKERRYFRIDELDKKYKEWWEFILYGELNDKLNENARRETGILRFLQGRGKLFGVEFIARSAIYFNVEYILDSSKTTPINLLRPMYLSEEGMNVLVLHLIRDPVSVLRSYYKRGVKNIFLLSYISAKWLISTLLTFFIYKDKNYLLIDFDDLMKNPIKILHVINQELNIPVDQAIYRLENNLSFDQGGGFLGNGMRRKKDIYFNPTRSKVKVPLHVKIMGIFLRPLYNILSSYSR